MSGFAFGAKAALEQARQSLTRPNLPNLPNRGAFGGAGLGRLGGLGTARTSDPKMTHEELALDLFEERAAIREYDGGQDRAEAEAAAWQEAMRATGITALDEWRQRSDGNQHRQRSWKMKGDSDER